MEPETPTPFWKKLAPKPSGSIPGGLFSQVAIGLIALLGGAMILSHQFCGSGQLPPTPGGEQQEPVAGGAGLGRRLTGMTEQQRRQKEHEERDRARRQHLQQQETLAAGLGGATVSRARRPGAPTGGSTAGPGQPLQSPPDGQQYQTDAEFELMERLRLEDIERKRRSLRVGPVVLSRRGSPAVTNRETSEPDRQRTPSRDPEIEELHALLDRVERMEDPEQQDPELGAPDGNSSVQSAIDSLAAGQSQPPPSGAEAGRYDDPTRLAAPLDPPGMERIYEGSFLEGVLVTQLSGEFTGPVLAMVAVPFYSADRQRILVPRGTRAVGTAQAVGGANQERLAVGFHRLVFPDGRWVELTFDGLDQAGDSALKDKVNRHYLSMFAAVGAVGVLSGLTLRGSHPYAGGMAGFRAGAGQSIAQSGMQILSRFLNRYPTITIRAGHRLRIWFTSDVLVPRPPPQGGER